ncbi:MAG: ATP phosphoribosyltransferase regulatory subunit [Paracoccaceae bacterium]
MAALFDTNLRAAQLRTQFEKAGAKVVEPPILQPADTLLDLYGEDIRARAYVTSDALHGEQMLRPDFTVPVVQMHMEGGAEPARYTYAGPVFRRQEHDPNRANEYVQVGYEVFDRSDPAGADAEVFARIAGAVSALKLQARTGDIGILTAAVAGLDTTAARKAALMRHIWRPRKFRQLLDRYASKQAMSSARRTILENGVPSGASILGKRRADEVAERIEALRADSATPPILGADLAAIDSLLAVRDVLPNALKKLQKLAESLPSIASALQRLTNRATALEAQGVDILSLEFDAAYGRTSLEYYDGFVFGFYAMGHPDWPAIASGGRYDALTQRLGQGAEIPAVGGVLRPGLMLDLEAGQ